MSRAPILSVSDLWLDAPGGRPLLRDLSLTLGRERVALVGRNGVGKSSLLEVLSGHEAPRQGRVVCEGRRLLIRQHLGDGGALPAATAMSPGERRRQALQAAHRLRPELLLLDEPTRDLDAAGVLWLADWLATWDGALMVVSHDRRILSRFRQFFVVAESGCRAFTGSIEELVHELEDEAAGTARAYARRLGDLLHKEQHNAAVRRRRARKKNVGRIRELGRCPSRIRLNGKRSYKQVSQGTRAGLQQERISTLRDWVKSTRRALAVALPLEVLLPTPPGDAARRVVILNEVAAQAGGRLLFSGLDLVLRRERVAVTGPNGSGKSTLLAILLGERRPDSGRISCGPERMGFIAQNAVNWCAPDSLLERLVTGSNAATLEDAAQILLAHKFPFALAERPLCSLSPGERLRAALIGLFQRRPVVDVLVLDEPTDDLDLLAALALEAVLRAWRGGLVIASHDEPFLRAIGIQQSIELDGLGGLLLRCQR